MSRYRNPFEGRRRRSERLREERRIAEERAILDEPPPKPKGCSIRQYSDQMNCSTCHLYWDTNDPDPPVCPKTRKALPESGRHEIEHE